MNLQLILFLLPQALPQMTLPEGKSLGANPLETTELLLVYGAKFLLSMVAIAVMLGLGWNLFGAFTKARTSADWGGFGISFIGTVLVAIVSMSLLNYGWQVIDNFSTGSA